MKPIRSGTILIVLAILLSPGRSNGLASNGLCLTPPMLWDGWNYVVAEGLDSHCQPNDAFFNKAYFYAVADSMISKGFRDAGYRTVHLICGIFYRDDQGNLNVNTTKFPGGKRDLVDLIDYIHSKGMQVQTYTDGGSVDCVAGPGIYGHWQSDIDFWASLGVDAIKEDWCGGEEMGLDPKTEYTKTRQAIAAKGYKIWLEICSQGQGNPWEWGNTIGEVWRVGGDISCNWGSIIEELDAAAPHAAAAGPGHWNFPDMLEVGIPGGLTDVEQRAHFSMWCMLASPLGLGVNVLKPIKAFTYETLTNPEVIAIDQDSLGIQGTLVSSQGDLQVWAKRLKSSTTVAVALFNRSTTAASITARWSDIGIPAGKADVRDLWQRRDIGSFDGSYSATVPAHGVVLVKVTGGGVTNLQRRVTTTSASVSRHRPQQLFSITGQRLKAGMAARSSGVVVLCSPGAAGKLFSPVGRDLTAPLVCR